MDDPKLIDLASKLNTIRIKYNVNENVVNELFEMINIKLQEVMLTILKNVFNMEETDLKDLSKLKPIMPALTRIVDYMSGLDTLNLPSEIEPIIKEDVAALTTFVSDTIRNKIVGIQEDELKEVTQAVLYITLSNIKRVLTKAISVSDNSKKEVENKRDNLIKEEEAEIKKLDKVIARTNERSKMYTMLMWVGVIIILCAIVYGYVSYTRRIRGKRR